MRQVQDGLLTGEHVQAVYDCTGTGTGFVGVTNLRVILQDKSFIGKNVAITSIPFKQIRTVSVLSNSRGRVASSRRRRLPLTPAGRVTSPNSVATKRRGTFTT